MKRKMIHLILVLSLILGTVQPCFAAPEQDVEVPQIEEMEQQAESETELIQPIEKTSETEESEEAPELLAAPQLQAVSNEVDGIRLTWLPVDGAAGYNILRQDELGEWKAIGQIAADLESVEQLEYLDPEVLEGQTQLLSGTSYCYTVQAYDAAGNAGAYEKTGWTVDWLSAPEVSVSGTSGQINLSWTEVTGADAYRILRKTADHEWELRHTVDAAEWTDTLPQDEMIYYYTVQAVKGDETVSASREGIPAAALATPALSVANKGKAVRISWKAIPCAQEYYVYRKQNNTWKRIAEVKDAVQYDDLNGITSGNSYTYTVKAVLGDVVSDYNHSGVSIRYLPAPVLSISSGTDRATISWSKVNGADGYLVYRKSPEDTTWIRQAKVGSSVTSYTDQNMSYGVKYTYTVKAYEGSTNGGYDAQGVQAQLLEIPEVSVSCAAGIVQVNWNAIAGAESYRVYRRQGNGGWKFLQEIDSCTFRDDISASESGTVYSYTVRAKCDAGMSTYRSSREVVMLSEVQFTLTGVEDGISIDWDAVPGAETYRVYRKNEAGEWIRIATPKKSTVSYLDKDAESGKIYTYTVRAASGVSLSGYQPEGKNGIQLEVPEVSVSCAAGIVQVNWNAIAGAESYRVYRRQGNGGWKFLQEIDSCTFRDDISASESGTVYSYTVRAKCDAGMSTYRSSREVVMLSEVQFTLSSAVGGVSVQWEAVPGAETYRVYRKNEAGEWVRIATPKKSTVSYLDKDAESGKTYTYTVRAASGVSLSGYQPEGKLHAYLAAPTVTASCTAGTATASWKAVAGAQTYQVYRSVSGANWKFLKEVSADTLQWKEDVSGQASGTVYRYTVRAKSENGRSSYAGSNSVVYLSIPSFSVSNEAGGIQITWKAVSGTTEYRVYRKQGSSDWKRIATLSESKRSYLDKNVENSVKYTYTVRAAAANSISGYDKAGTSITCSSYKTALANNQLPTNISLPNVTREKYGTSGEGRALYAYSVGTGKNHMVLNFAIHGWEDNWSRDGYELVRVAVKVLEKLSANASTVKQKGWTVTVIPYANPDGIVSGTTNNGPGRCTTYRYNSSGKLVKGGVDLNRCFPTGFSASTSSRNYTGSEPLMAKEGKALRALMDDKKGSGDNIFMDIHGWTQQILTNSSGSGKIYKTLHEYFPNNSAGGLGGGYAARYAKAIGYDACLFEFPRNVTSHSVMTSKGYDTKFVNAIMDLIREY